MFAWCFVCYENVSLLSAGLMLLKTKVKDSRNILILKLVQLFHHLLLAGVEQGLDKNRFHVLNESQILFYGAF